jgi:hypothetical protein
VRELQEAYRNMKAEEHAEENCALRPAWVCALGLENGKFSTARANWIQLTDEYEARVLREMNG